MTDQGTVFDPGPSVPQEDGTRVLTPIDVSQQLLTSPSGMTGKLDRLEQQGLIHRSPDPVDQRAIRLGITKAGRTLIDEAFARSLRVYNSMVDILNSGELKRLNTLLEELLAQLDELSIQRQSWASSEPSRSE
ncbi:MAG TPA: MarR family transcriptional regulator [Acidimicrobiia bacterium]|nr:MarR family transcriptional regulator [Acidimicrobiia bacterium]